VNDVLSDIEAWLRAGQRVAVARVVEVIGSGPRLAGAVVAVTGSGEVAGSAAGGCLEGAIIERAGALLETGGTAQLLSFGPADDDYFSLGLACGGSTEVFVEVVEPELVTGPGAVLAELSGALGAGRPVALVEVIEGPGHLLAHKALVYEGSRSCSLPGCSTDLATTVAGDARLDLALARNYVHRYHVPGQPQPLTVFVEAFPAAPVMVIFGAAGVSSALVTQARLLGYRTVICDARALFCSQARFPSADEVVVDWPDRYLARAGGALTGRDAICVLTHDPKFDIPAIVGALATNVGYIGLMGSRRAQAERKDRLRQAGVSEADLGRLHGPIGLDLGAASPAETAVSICAEIIAARTGRPGGPLAATTGPIHGPGARAAGLPARAGASLEPARRSSRPPRLSQPLG